jgi:hypothetical protein
MSFLLWPCLLAAGCGAQAKHAETATEAGETLTVPPREEHTVTTLRAFDSPFEEQLIAAAEQAAPRLPEDSDLDGAEPEWWTEEFDGVRIAGAITSDAIAYYTELSEAFRRGDFSGSAGIQMYVSNLTYAASAQRQATCEYDGRSFDDVYVVTMELTWGQWCGLLCSMGFDLCRAVVFDLQGELLGVFGDGEPEVFVS